MNAANHTRLQSPQRATPATRSSLRRQITAHSAAIILGFGAVFLTACGGSGSRRGPIDLTEAYVYGLAFDMARSQGARAIDVLDAYLMSESEDLRNLAVTGFQDALDGKQPQFPEFQSLIPDVSTWIALMNQYYAQITPDYYPIVLDGLGQHLPERIAHEYAVYWIEQDVPTDGQFLDRQRMAAEITARRERLANQAVDRLSDILNEAQFAWAVDIRSHTYSPDRRPYGATGISDRHVPTDATVKMVVPVAFADWATSTRRDQSPMLSMQNTLQLRGQLYGVSALFFRLQSPFDNALAIGPVHINPANGTVSVNLTHISGETAQAIRDRNPRLALEKSILPIVQFNGEWAGGRSSRYQMPYDSPQSIRLSGGWVYESSMTLVGGRESVKITEFLSAADALNRAASNRQQEGGRQSPFISSADPNVENNLRKLVGLPELERVERDAGSAEDNFRRMWQGGYADREPPPEPAPKEQPRSSWY